MRVLKWLDKNLEIGCMAVLLIIMTALSFTNVVLRYCFSNALSWSDEVCCYCLAISAFLSLPATIRNQSMIRVDTFTMTLPKPVQRIISIACMLMVGVFCVILVKRGYRLLEGTMRSGQRSPALQIPVAYFYRATMICFVLAVIRAIQVVILEIFRKEEVK